MNKYRHTLLPLLPLLGLYGCDISPKEETLVTSGGLVNKGILSQAIADAYKAGADIPIKRVYTRSDGTFSLEDLNFEGALYVVVKTTSQTLATCDSAQGCGEFDGGLKLAGESDQNLNGHVDFGDKYFFNEPAFKLSAFLQTKENNTGRFAVTPLTHLASEKISHAGNLNTDTIAFINAQVAELFGLDGIDISRILPPDITNESQMLAASDAQRMYAALNAAVASAAQNQDVATVINELASTFVQEGGLIANSGDPNKVTLATLQQYVIDVANVVAQKYASVDMSNVITKAQYERDLLLAMAPETIVAPSSNPTTNPDFDGDGISDAEELTIGTDPLKADTDEDGLLDGKELIEGTNPLNNDTDNDGMWDGWEVFYELNPLDPADKDRDPDADGLINIDEFTNSTDPNNEDTDGDGLKDGTEVGTHGTSPTSFDTDNDGLNDFEEINTYQTDPTKLDSDGDTMADGWEINFQLNPLDPADALNDFDEDGLFNKDEFSLGTSPDKFDSDNDGVSDGNEDHDGDLMNNAFEFQFGLDPFKDDAAFDNDGDTITNLQEFERGSDPSVPNPTIEFVSDANIYSNSSSGAMALNFYEDSVLTARYDSDITDLSFFNDVIGNTTLDNNSTGDVVFHDLSVDKYGIPIRQNSDGTTLLNGWSNFLDVTPDGFRILFSSQATNVVAGDSNGYEDLFVFDRFLNMSTRLGTNAQLNNASYKGSISATGDVIAMASNASNLVATDTNGYQDIFTYKVNTSTATLISRNYLANDSANGGSYDPKISSDGQRIVFSSDASNILDNSSSDGNSSTDVYFFDGPTGTHKRVSVTKSITDDISSPPYADYPQISANGKAIVYVTQKDILDLGLPSYPQIYYVDVESMMLAGQSVEQYTTLITKSWDGSNFGDSTIDAMNIKVSADGEHVFFKSASQNLVSGDANAASLKDLFVWSRTTNEIRLLSQFVYGKDASGTLIYDSNPAANHINGMGIEGIMVNADDSSVYAVLEYGYDYTDAPSSCAGASSYCLFKINLPLMQLDSDGDGLNDRAEETLFSDPNNQDTDNDGLSDGIEVNQYRTSPIRPDSDEDGTSDGAEVNNGSDPLDPNDPNP